MGNRLSTVLGSGSQPGSFEKLIRQNQLCGITRLEISVCPGAIENYSPWNPSVKTKWHDKVINAIEILVNYALNDPRALSVTYRRMSLPRMISCLCGTETNILAVGKRLSWIINSKTGHRNFFVGTQGVADISSRA